MQKTKETARPKRLVSAIILVIGLSILNYPTVARMINYVFAYRGIVDYQSRLEEKGKETSELLQSAQDYNASIVGEMPDGNYKVDERFQELSLLRENEMLGYINVPSIKLYAPIHYGSSDSVLKHDLGLMEGSSLPLGGVGTHAVISGHTGMAVRKLFSELDKVNMKDLFFLYSMNQKLAYEVDQIKVVSPDDNTDLLIEKDHDYVTLITCTPYGINSHRLLVRGHRIDYDFTDSEHPNIVSGMSFGDATRLLLLLISIIIITVVIHILVKDKSKSKGQNETK